MSDKKLKLCPFCGKEPYIRKGQGYEVGCRDELCYAYLPSDNEDEFWATEEQAVKAWNTRPESPLVGLDEKELYKDIELLILTITDKLDPHWDEFVNKAKSIVAKFGSPQKESGELEKVLEEFDILFPNIVEIKQMEFGVIKKYSSSKRAEIKSFIRTHWPKPL